ncbi:hypothetical protein ABZ863_30035 [Saccharomonospora sp. NPDC046836]|uniref:hypothetical protein n=1 Tax=Saccharomonospora sp. NPDC046836 TaxID=3156921 RepID=UPI0033FFE9DB
MNDVSRIHCAIRATKQMVFHLMDENIWEVPEIAAPPSAARVLPPTKGQRIRSGFVHTIQAGFATAVLGLLAAIFALTTKLI